MVVVGEKGVTCGAARLGKFVAQISVKFVSECTELE